MSDTGFQDSLPLDVYAELAARVLSGIPATKLIAKFKAHTLTAEEVQDVLTMEVSSEKAEGKTWDAANNNSLTMIGLVRLRGVCRHLQHVDKLAVPGHFIETGVWRGGCCIFVALLLRHMGNPFKRAVFACDSFCGLPPPDAAKYPVDHDDKHHTVRFLAVSLEEVQGNAHGFGVCEDIVWEKGWFCDTLPPLVARGTKFAISRLDGDMYGSTMEALRVLEPATCCNGVVIIDDWTLTGARAATIDYRRDAGITAPVIEYGDDRAMYWIKPDEAEAKAASTV
jgi:O-methyltransferase